MTWFRKLSAVAALITAIIVPSVALALGANSTSGDITVLNANVSSGTATSGSTVATIISYPNTATIYKNTSQWNTVGVQVTGTFTATLTFQSSADEGATWVSHTVATAPVIAAAGTQVTTATSTGNWVANVSGFTNFRVTCTAYTSGTASVTLTKAAGHQLVGISTMPSTAVTNAAIAATGATAATSAMLSAGQTTTAAPTYTNGHMNALSLDTGGAMRVTGLANGATGATVPTGAILGGGSVTTAAPTYTNGQMSALNLATNGSVRMDISSTGGTTLVADDSAIVGVPVPIGYKAVATSAQPTAVTAGDVAYGIATLERIPIVTTRHPNHIKCQVTVSTATTIQAVGGSCAAPGAGLSIYITDIDFSTNAAAISADSSSREGAHAPARMRNIMAYSPSRCARHL